MIYIANFFFFFGGMQEHLILMKMLFKQFLKYNKAQILELSYKMYDSWRRYRTSYQRQFNRTCTIIIV